ncbi:hypothetical protein [Streptomyces clavifer]|uniref:hypothetical protein n=1 Tax=Streptomyces clavifer TaxID=68188 RepID=UPI0033EBF797
MTTQSNITPQEDIAFFDEISAVFREHPGAARRYAITKLSIEAEMGIDLNEQHGVSRVEGKRIITEFVDRNPVEPKLRCAREDFFGNCIEWREDFPK